MTKNFSFAHVLFAVLAVASLTPWISAPIALLLGIIFTNLFVFPVNQLGDYTKKILQYSIIGLGFSINLQQAVEAGSKGLLFTISGIVLVFLLAYLFSKLLKVEKKVSQLIASGTAICGGSAIAAIAPVIKADNQQNSVALGTVFLLNAVALFLFPYLGNLFELTPYQFGMWAAIAIHDTSSVVGAASKYGAESLHVATTVKLARALFIIPLSLIFSFIYKSETKIKFPLFILFYVIAIVLNTYVKPLQELSPYIANMAKAGMKLALFLIGMGLTFKNFKSIGVRPLIMGVLIWILISGFSLYGVLKFLS